MKDFDIRSSLTSRVFRFVVLSFFISNITTILGAVIDGFVVGNTMDTATIAVVGFVSPVVIFFSMGIFGGITAGNILSVLIIPIFIAYIKRRTGCRDHLLRTGMAVLQRQGRVRPDRFLYGTGC